MAGFGFGFGFWRGSGPPQSRLRIEPGTADVFYLVQKMLDGTGNVTRFQRNTGGSGGADAGVSWPEFRPTGLGLLTSYSLPVSGNVVWVANEVGAFDLVGRNAGLVFFSSYHGLGSAGSLVSEAITIDGIAVDHTQAVSGNSFELRNSTIASNGTDSLSRDISFLANAGALDMRINSISSSGMSLVYFGMPMSTGTGFSELFARWTAGDNFIPLGGGEAVAYLADAAAVRHRDPSTGYFSGASASGLSALAGFVQCRTDKEVSNTRTKSYLSQFSSTAALAGAVVTIEWGSDAPGATSPPANILTNTTFTSPAWSRVQTGGTVTDSAGEVTMTWSSGTSNLRTHLAIGSQVGSKYIASIDTISFTGAGTREFYIGSNSNGSNSSPAPAASRTAMPVGRTIVTFTGTVAVPEQRFALRHAATAAATSVYKNPAVYDRVG